MQLTQRGSGATLTYCVPKTTKSHRQSYRQKSNVRAAALGSAWSSQRQQNKQVVNDEGRQREIHHLFRHIFITRVFVCSQLSETWRSSRDSKAR